MNKPKRGGKPRRKTVKEKYEREAKEEILGVTQMASLVISHLFAPLWSIGMNNEDLQRSGCLRPVVWKSPEVDTFTARMDKEGETNDSLTAQFGRMYEILVDNPVLCTVYMVLNIARLEHIEHNAATYSGYGHQEKEGDNEDISYAALLIKQLERNRTAAKLPANERNHGWNDEIFSDHATRSLTDMGGEALVKIEEKPKAKAMYPKLARMRRELIHVLLLASCSCHYNFHDDALYNICSLVCTKMFLIAPAEVLSNLVCGQKGPVYLSKFLRFLMASTGPLVQDNNDSCLPGKITNSSREALTVSDASQTQKKKEVVPSHVNDAWLVIFSALINLCHSSNRKAGQNICAAFSVALRDQLSKISRLQQRISDLEEHKQYDDVSKKSYENTYNRATTGGITGMFGLGIFGGPEKGKKEDAKEHGKKNNRSQTRTDEKRRLQDAVAFYSRPLPSLLSLIRIFLCRIHCYGEDGPRAWGELMSTVRQLQVYPHRVGSLAVEIMRAATAAVQCMDSLLRYRFSRCLVGGGGMLTLKRDRAYLLANKNAARVLSNVYLGELPRFKAMGDASLHIPMNQKQQTGVEAELERLKWTDEILASASLALNILQKVARKEAVSSDPFRRDMQNTITRIPPDVLAQHYHELYAVMTGPQGGGLGRLITFSEGADPDSLRIPDSILEAIVALYGKMLDAAGDRLREDYKHLHIPAPCYPAVNISTKFHLPDPHATDFGYMYDPCVDQTSAIAGEDLLEQIIKEERRYYQEELDYWGRVTPKLQPYEIKLLVAGGSSAIREFAQAIARLYTSGKRLGRFPVFRVYVLPIGDQNLLSGWMEKNDAVYKQMVTWPLGQAASAAEDNGEFQTPRAKLAPRPLRQPMGFESMLLRTAMDTYLVDADKINKVYVYRCDCWKEADPAKGEREQGECITLAWCQQVELGPGTDVPRKRAEKEQSCNSPDALTGDGTDAVSLGSSRAHRGTSAAHGFPRNKSRGSSIGRSHAMSVGPSAEQDRADDAAQLGTRRLTVIEHGTPPLAVELGYQEQKSSALGLHYPDLRQPKEMFAYKISLRNCGKEGDIGLYPDPTDPTLQMYVLGHPERQKAQSKFSRSSEGVHYTILGNVTIVSKEPDRRGFEILVDGVLYGPFVKVQVGPWLVNHQADDGAEDNMPRRHVGFDVMSFCPLNIG